MAHTGIFATAAQIIRKAGLNANATAIASEALINDYAAQSESEINAATRYNWSDKYATLNVDVKSILTRASSNLAAMDLVNYDPDAWNLSTTQTKLDVLEKAYLRCLSILRDIKSQTFAIGA